MKTVLVTGAGGFIGSHLAEDQLKKNRLVKAFDINLDRLSHLSSNDRCQLITGDIRSEDLLKKIFRYSGFSFFNQAGRIFLTIAIGFFIIGKYQPCRMIRY